MRAESRLIRVLGGNVSEKEWENWRWQFSHRLQDAAMLPEQFPTGEEDRRVGEAVSARYPFCVTPYYLSLVRKADEDPVRLQFLPQKQELNSWAGCEIDPLGEDAAMPVPGLIHRYPDRCLILVTHQCAVHCRHCNRKRFWGSKSAGGEGGRLQAMIDYVSRHRGIREVIFSGGDPLVLGDQKLEFWLAAFRCIPHVEVLRIGSRMPVVAPMRITRALCRVLKRHRPLWLNTQFNHANEITKESARACEMLLEAGIPVSNQSVLLKGVNDTFDAMRNLLYGLQGISVRPYYLFHCEPVAGAGHFQVDMKIGQNIMERIWRECSGLCQPNYVIDTVEGRGKIPLPVHSFLCSQELACYGKSGQS